MTKNVKSTVIASRSDNKFFACISLAATISSIIGFFGIYIYDGKEVGWFTTYVTVLALIVGASMSTLLNYRQESYLKAVLAGLLSGLCFWLPNF